MESKIVNNMSQIQSITDNIEKVINAVNQKLPYILLNQAVEDKTVANLMKGVDTRSFTIQTEIKRQ